AAADHETELHAGRRHTFEVIRQPLDDGEVDAGSSPTRERLSGKLEERALVGELRHLIPPQFKPGKPAHFDLLSRLAGQPLYQVANRDLVVLHERLLEQHVLLIELLELALD